MAKSSSNNRNFSIRLPEGLIEKIDNEVETFRDEASRSEFITDAVKFYLRYKAECREKMENQRLMMDVPASTLKDRVLIDLENTSLTLGEVLGRVESYKNDPEYMDCEIFMDGDRFAIVARWKVCA